MNSDALQNVLADGSADEFNIIIKIFYNEMGKTIVIEWEGIVPLSEEHVKQWMNIHSYASCYIYISNFFSTSKILSSVL